MVSNANGLSKIPDIKEYQSQIKGPEKDRPIVKGGMGFTACLNYGIGIRKGAKKIIIDPETEYKNLADLVHAK